VAGRLRGPSLVLARAAWAGVLVLSVGTFAVAIPPRLEQLRDAAGQAEHALGQRSSARVPEILRAALSPGFYPGAVLTVEIALMAAFALAALAIFGRRSDDPMAIFASVTLLSFGALASPALDALASAQPTWRFPVALAQGVGLECELLIFYLSPDGRFVPGWTRPLAAAWTIWRVAALTLVAAHVTFVTPQPYAYATSLSPGEVLWFLAWLGWIASALLAQIARYRRVSTPTQRQQTKWALIGAMVAALGYVAFVLPRIVLPFVSRSGLPNLLYRLIGTPLYLVCLLLVPLCVAFSILRYRLWDVDIFINRALVYGALTATLALIYFGCVMLLGQLLRALTGRESSAEIVVSTLAIAALFDPLRRRIQAFIDRRFYRRKYDAARALAAFGATLRLELDLAQLSERLLTVVDETMQPTHASLWLRRPSRDDTGAEQMDRLPALRTAQAAPVAGEERS
jgi:hypothetical protein